MRKYTVSALVIATAIALTGCSTVQTQPDQQALRYSDPMFGAKEFKQHFGPSSYDMASPLNETYVYPAGQRTYAFLPEGGDTGIFTPATKEQISLGVAGTVRFSLTDDPELLKEFHEKVGLRLEAHSDEGWRKVLNDYLRASIERALNDATQGREWSKLYSSDEEKAAWEREVAELLPGYITETIGGPYFNVQGVTLQKPTLPDELERRLQRTQEVIEENKAQEEQNKQVDTEMESIDKLVERLGVEGYIQREAIKDGKVTVLPIPAGTDIAVQPN